MLKGLVVMEENMSNLTSASSEISGSSGSRIHHTTNPNPTTVSLYPHLHHQSSTSRNEESLPKKKRNLPGHPGHYFVN